VPKFESADPLTALGLKALLHGPFDRALWEAVASPNLHLRIANAPPATGRTAALDALQAFLARIEGFGCHYCDLWRRREAIYAETDVRFTNREGRLCTIPCALVARVTRGQLQDLRLHLDPSPIP
jgi:hypothetical protein